MSTLKRWRQWWLRTLRRTLRWIRSGALAVPPDEAPLRWLLKRIRGRGLLKVAARMRITARKVWVSFPSAYPYREEFAAIYQAVRAPPDIPVGPSRRLPSPRRCRCAGIGPPNRCFRPTRTQSARQNDASNALPTGRFPRAIDVLVSSHLPGSAFYQPRSSPGGLLPRAAGLVRMQLRVRFDTPVYASVRLEPGSADAEKPAGGLRACLSADGHCHARRHRAKCRSLFRAGT